MEESVYAYGDEIIEIDGNTFFFNYILYQKENGHSIVANVKIHDNEGLVLNDVKFEPDLRLPFDPFTAGAVIGGRYGLCVAGGVFGATAKHLYACYQAEKASGGTQRSPSELAKAVLACLSAKKVDLKGEVVKALTGCLPKISGP